MAFPVWRTLAARLALGALLAVTATQADASSPITKTTVAVADAPALAAALGEQAAASAVDVNEQPTSRAGDLVIARKSASTSASQVVERVIADLDATYDDHTTVPSASSAGAEMPVEIRITNTGKRTWVAGGDQPIRLGYHWYDADGHTLLEDGATAALPVDVSTGQTTAVAVIVRAPQVDGTYMLAWDLVQEGVGWFSASAVSMKSERVVVGDGVTFYGKGWGHGIGLSQWGAQGWAQGAAGPRLSGEEILAKYFPGANLVSRPEAPPFRVLISAPSNGCVGRTIFDSARMSSEGGMRLVNDADPAIVYAQAAPGQTLRASRSGAAVMVTDEWSRRVVYAGRDAVRVVPVQPWDPISISEKGLSYRGDLWLQTAGGSLTVVNVVSPDDYMRGVLPGEMLPFWEIEALRAQAVTARTYAAWKQSSASEREWDVRDDVSDQCYGGHSAETERTNTAVGSTAGQFLFYDGEPIRAMFSSANGGATENPGCVFNAIRVGDTWGCAEGWSYLSSVPDPAELAAYDKRGANPYAELWAEHFSGGEIRAQILVDYGVDIGQFLSMAFNESAGGRPISVIVRGNRRSVDLHGDQFLRRTLGLASTMVRTAPF
ncbi:MAG: SpoIID/LytB domain-containing protein [Chloroflexi bacterium]|nr:MAG: SpoIID/LytB domain-containing protein [Chloroflexota bacterium]